MSYDTEAASRDLKRVEDGVASFESRARLERFLLMRLERYGEEALGELLGGLPAHHFRVESVEESGSPTRFVSAGPTTEFVLVVEAHLGEHLASINVVVESLAEEAAEEDPRHRAFYEVWESIPAEIADSELARLDTARRAVFFIAPPRSGSHEWRVGPVSIQYRRCIPG